MSALNIITTLVVYGLSLVLVSAVSGRLKMAPSTSAGRVSSLDGLRAILATSVIAAHMVVTWKWHTTGTWDYTDSRVLTSMGVVPVSIFFMITGYLFTRKLIKGEPVWGRLFVSRVKRIMPMYVVSVVFIALVSLWQSWPHQAGLASLGSSFASWLIFVRAPFNDFPDSVYINAQVQWTLLFEVFFYLLLPLLFCIIRRRFPVVPLIVSLLVLACLWTQWGYVSPRFLLLFLSGIGVGLLEDWLRAKEFNYEGRVCTLLVLVLTAVAFSLSPYSVLQMMLLTIPFAIFVLGNSLGGLLVWRGLRLLGDASFSIYLLHGIVIYFFFSVLGVYSFDSGSYLGFVALLPVVMAITCAVSLLAWHVIERPAMAWGTASGKNLTQSAEDIPVQRN